MKTRNSIVALAVRALVLTPLVGLAKGPKHEQAGARAQVERSQHDFDRDRIRARDRDEQGVNQRDRTRDKDRTKAPETAKQAEKKIYGQEMMSETSPMFGVARPSGSSRFHRSYRSARRTCASTRFCSLVTRISPKL